MSTTEVYEHHQSQCPHCQSEWIQDDGFHQWTVTATEQQHDQWDMVCFECGHEWIEIIEWEAD